MRDLQAHTETETPSIFSDRGSPVQTSDVRRSPLRLADAEWIAAVQTGQYPEAKVRAARSAASAAGVDTGMSTDVLDLPEPDVVYSIFSAPLATVSAEPATSAAPQNSNDFDYSAWSRELDDLLKRPLMPTHRQRSHPAAPAHSGRIENDEARALIRAPLMLRSDDAPPSLRLTRPKRVRGAWMPVFVLGAGSLLAAGLIGGAAYGLASPDAMALVTGATQWIGQLQNAAAR
jgi:hypothetical protein